LLGEYKRWYDLKRTGKLEELATEHNIHVVPGCFDGYNGYKKYLRPIPQEAIDLNQNKVKREVLIICKSGGRRIPEEWSEVPEYPLLD